MPGSHVNVQQPQDAEARLQLVWNQALKEFQDRLSVQQYRKLQSVGSCDQLRQEVSSLAMSYRKRVVPRLLARLDPLFQQLQFFTRSISIFISSHPEVSALVWGSIYTVIEYALRHKRNINQVWQALDYIEKHLPRIKSFADLFVVSNRIEKAICSLYHDLIHFCLQAIVFLEQNPLLNLFGITCCGKRPKFEGNVSDLAQRIREQTEWINNEANVGLHIMTHQLTKRNHQDVLAAITAIASPPVLTPSSTICWRVLPLVQNANFFGRKDELDYLNSVIDPKRNDKLCIVSIVGEGGVGKSQLALQFAYTHMNDFKAIFWVSADNTVKMAQAFEGIAMDLDLFDASNPPSSLATAREATKKWLQRTSHNWLLVFDNVGTMSSLDDYWPTGARGFLVITSRDQNLVQSPISATLHLKCLNTADGVRFILEGAAPTTAHSAHHDDIAKQDAARICNACGGLPLALAQVVRYIRSSGISISDARRLCYSSESFVSFDSTLNKLRQPDYYHGLGTASLWEVALQSLHPPCRTLSQLFSQFDPDGIPRKLHVAIDHPIVIAQLGGSTKVEESIMTLLHHSLVAKATSTQTYTMHRLIQATIVYGMSNSDRSDIFQLALSLVDHVFPDYDDNDRLLNSWPDCGLYLPHVVRLSELFSPSIPYGIDLYLKLGQLLERASWYLQERGARTLAMPLLHQALLVAQQGLHESTQQKDESISVDGSSPMTSPSTSTEDYVKLVCDINNSLGMLELRRSRFDVALQHFIDSVNMRMTLGVIDDELIYTKRNVGIAYLSANRVQEAHATFEESMVLRQKQFRSDLDRDSYKDSLAANFGSLSSSLMALGRLDDAWKAASRSTALCQQVHGDKGPLIANCHTTLGWIRKAQGRLDEAEAFFLSALDMYTQSHGDVEEKAVALHNYAAILKSKGDYPSAVSVMNQAVDLLRTMPDASHLLARSLFYLSTYQRDQSGHATNNKLEDEAFSLYKKHVGDSVTKAQAKLTKSDYDNLLIFYFR